MKKAFYYSLWVLLAISCRTGEIVDHEPGQVFYATLEAPGDSITKVFADENMKVLWNADDRIAIFKKNTLNQQYRFTGADGANAGGFAKVSGGQGTGQGSSLDYYYAVYPYDSDMGISDAGVLNVTLPAVQEYKEHSFGIGANTMVSVTANTTLRFRNAGGYLAFKLYGDNVKVSRITLEGNQHEKLAGAATIAMEADGFPTVSMQANASESVTLVCNPAVSIGSGSSDYTEFWLVIPPTYFKQGFTVTVTADDGGLFSRSVTSGFRVDRNSLKRMSALEVIPEIGEPLEYPDPAIVSYTASDEVFPNPERGFYVPLEISEADEEGIDAASLKASRLQGRSLYLLEFHLTDYVETDIAEDYLQTIRAKFQSLRDGGAKCILRFCYSDGNSEEDKPWDATPEQVSRHLEQVTPLIQEFYDVILVVQAGFIGSWGEWYYTENFTDDATCKALLDALLEAIPSDRQIELRTPAFKMDLYGWTLADTLTRAEAHRPAPKARLGGHNDCYLSSSDDNGTFDDKQDRDYWEAESAYTIMGGETCKKASYCHCEGSDKYNGTLKDMALYHFTYLNLDYHPSVIRRWKDEGCFEEIQKRLGYRYVLEEGQFTKEAKAGKPFTVKLTLRNDGFSPVQNPRDAELVLTDASGKVLQTWPLNSDPRYWMPGQQTVIRQTLTLPPGISGTLTLYLNLPDPCETLRGNPLFSIRLANEDLWQEDTGYNQLYSFTL